MPCQKPFKSEINPVISNVSNTEYVHKSTATNEESNDQRLKSEVCQAMETLSRYSLFAVEGAEIRRQTRQLSFTIDKSI